MDSCGHRRGRLKVAFVAPSCASLLETCLESRGELPVPGELRCYDDRVHCVVKDSKKVVVVGMIWRSPSGMDLVFVISCAEQIHYGTLPRISSRPHVHIH